MRTSRRRYELRQQLRIERLSDPFLPLREVRQVQASPSQWEGALADGRPFRAEYWHGWLRAWVVDPHLGRLDILRTVAGSPIDGQMPTDEMLSWCHARVIEGKE